MIILARFLQKIMHNQNSKKMTIFTKNEIKSRIRARFPDMAPCRVDETFRQLEELGVIQACSRKYFHIYILDESSTLWRDFECNTVGRS